MIPASDGVIFMAGVFCGCLVSYIMVRIAVWTYEQDRKKSEGWNE